MTRRITLTSRQLKMVPGYRKTLTVDRLKGMVAGPLTVADLDYAMVKRDGSDMVLIEMVPDTDVSDVKQVIHFKLEVPQVYKALKRGDQKPLPESGWRFFYDYPARRTRAAMLGVTDPAEEFAANIVMQLPDSGQGTLGDSIKQSIADPGHAILPFIQVKEAEG